MAEEFQESEVIFNEDEANEDNEVLDFPAYSEYSGEFKSGKPKRKKLRAKKNSVPMNIPENATRNSWFLVTDTEYSDDDDAGDDEMVPPHLIIRRRVAGNVMPFSVCTGIGRTLKGRDLSEVRNSILRLTGFLET